MLYTLINFFDIGSSIIQSFRTGFGMIAVYVYEGISALYNIFTLISRASILDNNFVNDIYRKVGLILSLFMVFKLIFSLIQALVDPEKLTDKKNGAAMVVKRAMIAIVLLGITPTIFKEAFKLQDLIIGSSNSDNVIYKLIVGNTSGVSNDFGRELATELFFGFYTDNEEPKYREGEIYDEDAEIKYQVSSYDALKQSIKDGAHFNKTIEMLGLRKGNEYVIEFDLIFINVVGIFVLWTLLMYCIQIAIRVFQLAYLQLIAPVPILSYVSNPEGTFKNWIKQCGATYLDLFLRLAIIYFVVYLASDVLNNIENANSILYQSLGTTDPKILNWIKIFLIIGLLLFAKKVPELLKDLFPDLAKSAGKFSLGLKPSKELKEIGTFATGTAIGAFAGAAAGFKHGKGTATGRVGNAFTGFFRGAAAGMTTKGKVSENVKKGMAAQRSASQRAYERNNDGSNLWGRTFGSASAARIKESFDEELKSYEAYATYGKIIDEELEKDGAVQAAMAAKKSIMERANSGGPAPTAIEIMNADEVIKRTKETALQRIMNAKGTANENKTVMSALQNAEAIRAEGYKRGYAGFGSESVGDYGKEYLDSVKATKAEVNNIKGEGGSRNKEYKEAEANAKYNKTK